jgi:hypothetical protein
MDLTKSKYPTNRMMLSPAPGDYYPDVNFDLPKEFSKTRSMRVYSPVRFT